MSDILKTGIKGSLFVILENIIIHSIAFLIPVILTRNLPKSDYGTFVLIPSMLLVVGYLSSFGLESVINRYVPEYIQTNFPKKINDLFWITLVLRFLILAIVSLIMWVFRDRIISLLNAPPLLYRLFAVILIYICLSRINTLIGDAFTTAYKQRHYVSIIRTILEATKLVLFTIVIYLNKGIYGLIYSLVIVRVIELIIYIIIDAGKIQVNCKKYNTIPKVKVINDYKRIRRFGLFSFLFSSMHSFRYLLIDNLIIAHYLTVAEVASYNIAALLPKVMRNLTPAKIFAGVALPLLIGKYVEKEDTTILRRSFYFLQRLNIFLIIPIVAGILILGPKIIIYFIGPTYSDSIIPMYVLVSLSLFMNITDPFYIICDIIEKKEFVFISSIWAVYNLIMDFILIKNFGIIGAAVATGTASLLNFVYFWIVFKCILKRNFGFPVSSLFKVLINTIVMCLPVLILHKYINSIYSIILACILAATVYFFMSIINKIFTQEERDAINNNFNKKWFVF